MVWCTVFPAKAPHDFKKGQIAGEKEDVCNERPLFWCSAGAEV